MVTVLIIAAVLSVIVGIWMINKNQTNESLKEINIDNECGIDDLAPEATPTPALVAEIVKKNTKKKTAKTTSKNTAKNKSLAKMEAKPKKKSTKK